MKRQRGRNNRRNNNNNQNNNPNRSMDSNGPDVKVRGSANTIYEKYVQLARDAKTSGNRIKAESYLQHAEHYLRLHRSLQPKVDPAAEAAKKAAAAEAAEKRAAQQQEGGASAQDENKGNKSGREGREKRSRRPRRDNNAEGDESRAQSDDNDAEAPAKKPKAKKEKSADSDQAPEGLDVIEPSLDAAPEVKPRRRSAVRKAAPKASAETAAE